MRHDPINIGNSKQGRILQNDVDVEELIPNLGGIADAVTRYPQKKIDELIGVDGETIRSYFNAGFHVTRPEGKLLSAWRDTYFRVYREPILQEFYRRDRRYRVSVHQAVFSGVILSTLAWDEIQELPPAYNYPLHLHSEDVTEHRPTIMEELVTIRHEGFYADPEWYEKMPAEEHLRRWIAEHLLQ